MPTPLSLLLPLLYTFAVALAPGLHLQQDLERDLARLTKDSRYFISDNSTLSPSVETVAADLQLFQLAASLDLAKASHSSYTIGNHQVDVWQFTEGDIKSVYQIESAVHLDTVVTQRYLDNRTPTKKRITNDFSFRSYAISTATEPLKLYYLTEASQGLLSYHLGKKQVEITYAATKEGLADILPRYREEIKQILTTSLKSAEIK
ncbi:hypothetical protein ACFS7Z_10755 [Pontibacter toksunensis]|uniref:Uncharacterized protein n=1 Tax=Pontibacter toksunensis TaxID=1332631 RepID=A0ABW6BV34_9BACT